MEQSSIAAIELEMALLVRQLVSMTTYKKNGSLDRAAYLLLHHILASPACSVKSIADEFHLDISTVSRQVASLEQRGYISRMPDQSDGRSYTLAITEPGAEVLKENQEARQEGVRQLLKDWEEAERQAFGELLRKFNTACLEQS
ncbi:MarR family winged helix-turn-helix transcriptional regulator [Paenibacillus tengchongensis]|uniref:MarR family winged helix-turn-helix transcriptional regulator n=1 Tax=Paenibacillus tengchongensis TaxID=2608684 RepID=UPI00124E0B86|nr:MarR family transcriptional regulator [Paenibacillus tengchongensis]